MKVSGENLHYGLGFFAKVIPLEAHVNKRLCDVGKSSCA